MLLKAFAPVYMTHHSPHLFETVENGGTMATPPPPHSMPIVYRLALQFK